MQIRQYIPVFINDNARTDAQLPLTLRSNIPAAEKFTKDPLIKILILDDRFGRYVHDRRHYFLDRRNRRIAANATSGCGFAFRLPSCPEQTSETTQQKNSSTEI